MTGAGRRTHRPTIRISVVVPTRNRGASAVATVQSILGNRHPSFELIVVDQSDTRLTESALEPWLSDSRCRYVRSCTRGISAARNVGIGLATGPIVAHTDDDCEVAPTWLASIEEAFQNQPEAEFLFGRVDAARQETGGFIPTYHPPRTIVVRGLGNKHRIEGMGACFAFRRPIWEALAGFDEMLGIGGAFHAAEESDFAARALAAGYAVGETPNFAAAHHGFRSWKEGEPLIAGYLFGIGAMSAKHLRLRPFGYARVLAGLAQRWAFGQPVVNLGHFPSRWLRLRAFARGFSAGWRQAVSPQGCFVAGDDAAAAAGPARAIPRPTD